MSRQRLRRRQGPAISFGARIYLSAAGLAAFVLFWLNHGDDDDFRFARGATLVTVALFWLAMFVGFGVEVYRRPLGILTSGTNRYSLSRLQMFLWTWLILSAVSAAALVRAFQFGGGDLATAFSIEIHNDLYVVMGVAFFTGAASPALIALKAQGASDPVQRDLAALRLNENVAARGRVATRPTSQPPRLSDLVEGDELASAGVVDLSKVQQLMLTVTLVGVYAAMLFGLFVGDQFFTPLAKPSATKTVLPLLNDDMVKLMVLSHAGYLGYKAAPKPPAAPDSASTFDGPPPTPDRKGGF
jgi:hypothetical protein